MKYRFVELMRFCCLLSAVVVTAFDSFAAAPTITDVTAKQRYPWNGKVDITYTMTGDVSVLDGDSLVIEAADSETGIKYQSSAVALSGNTTPASGQHHVVWDLNGQGIELKSDDVVFTVSYRMSQYCVIDVSTGADSATYPVSYLSEAPTGGWSDEFKTSKCVLRLIEPGTLPNGTKVIPNPFYIGIFECTQQQYEKVMGNNPSYFANPLSSATCPVESVQFGTIRSTDVWSIDVGENSFMGKLRTKTGMQEMDLPTDLQWEYACRAGTTSGYNNGGSLESDLRKLGRYSGNRSDGRGGSSDHHTTVGSYAPNAWGLYDMHGNVWEWCLGLSSSYSITSGGTGFLLRGGSWSVDAPYCTSSFRHAASYGDSTIGFRMVRTLSDMSKTLVSAVSESVVIDSRTGVSNRRADVVPWDASWIGGDPTATVVIFDNGTEARRATGTGEFTLSAGRHVLEYASYINDVIQTEVYTATVYRCSCDLYLGDVPIVVTKAAQEATCTEDGWTREVACGRCNTVFEPSNVLTSLGHVEVETKAAKAATCTEGGWTREVTCSRCSSILETSTVISALGHVEIETKLAKAVSCTEDGWTHEVKCNRCNAVLEATLPIPALGHVEVETKAAQAPTCTEGGWTHEVKCSRCNAVLEPSISLSSLGHAEIETKTAKAATCTEGGWTREVTCSRCSSILETSTVISALGHVEIETKLAKAASCTEDGWTHEVKCNRCNAVLEATLPIPALGHVEVETKAAQAPTCTEGGWTHEVTCSRCNAVLEASAAVPALGHIQHTSIAAVAPTCTADGRTAEIICSRCGIIFETSEHLPTLGHSGAITKPSVEATSSTPGLTAEITCTRCGEILQEQTTIPALGYIRNVTARQLWPHKKVEICYEIAADIGEVATSATLPTITCKYGNTTKTANSSCIYGDTACMPSVHRIVWDFEGQSIAINQSSVTFKVGYSSVSGVSGVAVVNTSSSVANGMSVAEAVELGYSPFADGEAVIMIDGVTALSSTNSGVFAWQPQTTGTHTLKHVSGDYEWTRTVNVTGLAFEVPPAPNPPTAEDANISIGSTSRAFASGGGSATITTSGSGTWTATASDDWITFPAYSSNTAGRPLAYRVVANSGVEERTGYIYVSGHVFTVTQAGVGGELDAYSADFETDGGTGSFTVLVDAQASWKARSNVDWISVTVEGTGNGEWGTAGVGEQRVVYIVAPWNEVSTRSGTITAAGCTFTVNQTGRRMKLSGANITSQISGLSSNFDYLSHVLSITVNALASTDWDIELAGTWISIVDAGTGHGAGGVALAINENPSWLARSGMVRIGTEWLTIKQAGRPSDVLEFAISPENTTASVKGANGIVSVMATPDLPWTATSQANWLTVMPLFQQGAGNGNIVYTASPNPTMANRSGSIVVQCVDGNFGVATHSVSQPAATAMISADSHTFSADGESFDVDVATDEIVNWTVAENIDWLSVVGSTSRIGPGTVTLDVSDNMMVDPREDEIMIAGHSFHVVQKGRTVEVEYKSRVFGTASDYATIDVHPDGNVTWIAATDSPDWIVIWGDDGCEYDSDGNVVGTGDHTIEYIVSDYVGDGAPRTGTITIGDKTVYITQRAYELSINPSATTVSGNANEGEVSVPATAGQIWNAIATEPWIAVVSGYDSGTGSGTVRYTYTDNDTGEERTGRIIIAGEEYTITQAARQMVAVNVTTRVVTGSGESTIGNGGVVSGAGTYDRGASVTLSATANDGYEFLNWTLPNGSTTGGAQLVVTADVNKEIFANFRRIPVYAVNGESVREGTSKTFTAPADVIDDAGTTKLVCLGTSRYPEKGTSFALVVTEDIDFEWDLWQTNYLVTVSQSSGGAIKNGSSLAPTTAWYSAGSTINLTAIPDSGKSFFRWNLSNPDNPVNPVENDSAFSASLRLCVSYPLNISAVFGTFDDTLSTALDAPALTFTTGGDAEWQPVIDATAQTGYTSARSGTIGAESETWLDTTVNGAGTLTFRWRVDCEKDDGGGATWDRLAVFTNGLEAARIDGKTDWETVTIEIPNQPTPNSSTQTLIRWSFYRDDFDEPGQEHENAAWIDGIEWK